MSNWARAKVHAGNDDVEIFNVQDVDDHNVKGIEIKSKEEYKKNRINDDAETGYVSRLGITGRRKRFPDRVKFQATHVVPAPVFTKIWFLKSLKKVFPESSLIASDEIPYIYISVICILFYFVFLGVGIFFGYATYMDMRSSYFLSMGGNQSLPGTTMKVQDCWEVPRTLSGTYYADSNGYWSTRSLHDPAKTMYGVTMSVLKITTVQFAEAMLAVINKMKAVSARAPYRDLAWNIIMFSSYYATIHGPVTKDLDDNIIPGGTMEFYAAADANILLGKRSIISATFANQFHGVCDPANINSYFDNGDKTFVFQFQLCERGFCKPDARNPKNKYQYIDNCRNWYANVDTSYNNVSNKNIGYNNGASYNISGVTTDLNDNVFSNNKIFDPQQFGYKYGKMKRNYAEVKVDSRSLTLALAVNYGMLQVADLTKMTKSEKLKNYLTNLARQQLITVAQANQIFPFFDAKLAPMEPIYCMLFEGEGSIVDVEMPNFNGDLGDDDAAFRALYDDDTTSKDDDTAHIAFGGSKLDIYELPRKVFVSYQFTIQNYDITKVGSNSSTAKVGNSTSKLDTDKGLIKAIISETLTSALNAYNTNKGPKGGMIPAINLPTLSIWYFNSDPKQYSGSSGFDPSRFSRRLEESDHAFSHQESERNGGSIFSSFFSSSRKLLPSTTTTTNTAVTFGFEFDASKSLTTNLYRALQDLSELFQTSTFIDLMNAKIKSTSNYLSTGQTFRNNLQCNAGSSSKLYIDPYSLALDTFFVLRKPTQDDDTFNNPNIPKTPVDDDYFKDDAIPPKPSRRMLISSTTDEDDDLDINVELDDRMTKTRDRILEILSEPNGNIFRRRLKPVKAPIPKITKNTGASCFVQVGDTFMYPIMSHFGQAGTTRCGCMQNKGNATKADWQKDSECLASAVFGLANNADNNTANAGDNNQLENKYKYYYKNCPAPPPPPPPGPPGPIRVDRNDVFPFLPKVCDEVDGHKIACQNFDINVGMVFYPGKVDPRDNKLKPNGKIFAFGETIYRQIMSKPTDGDLTMINSAMDAMGMIAGAANDYQDLLPDGVPGATNCRDTSKGTRHSTDCYGRRFIKKYSRDRWNKAFMQVCGATGCSMLNFRLRDKLTLPPMNIFDYRPNESPSYRNVLLHEDVLLKLKDHVPTAFIELFYQCISTVDNAWMTSVGVGNSNASLFASLSFTVLIIILLTHMKHRRSWSKKIYYSREQRQEEDDAAEKYRDQMMIDAIELLVEKEKARCSPEDPDFQNMERALDSIYKIDDKEYDVEWDYEDEKIDGADDADDDD